MAEISATLVKQLRDSTGAGMMECKKALADANGDMAKAADLLRERGNVKAQKREGRSTREGVISLSLQRTAGGIVELSCETDFVARTEGFLELANKLSALAAGDSSLGSAVALAQAKLDGTPVAEVIQSTIAKTGENIVLQRATHLAVSQGIVGGYVHAGSKLGVLVALETAAQGGGVAELAKDIAMHIAAVDPSPVAIDRSGVDQTIVDKEREFYRKQAEQSGKPEKVIEKIIEGQVNKFYAQVCLLEQEFVKDPDRSIAKVLADASKQLGGEIRVTGYVRFKLGETLA